MQQIKLTSSDGQIFEVDEKVARMSNMVDTMLNNLGGSDPAPIPLSSVSGPILQLVLDWAKHHVNDPAPDPYEDEDDARARDVSQWDYDFLKLDDTTLADLFVAANFLDMKPLLETIAKVIARTMVMGKTPEEIRQRFGLEDDLPKNAGIKA